MSQCESWRLNGGTINKNCMAAAALWWRPGFLQLHSSVAATEWRRGGPWIVACLKNIGSSRLHKIWQDSTRRLCLNLIGKMRKKGWIMKVRTEVNKEGRYHRQACRDGSYDKVIWGPGLRPARVLRIDQRGGGGRVARLVPDLGQSVFTRSSDVTRVMAITLIKTHSQYQTCKRCLMFHWCSMFDNVVQILEKVYHHLSVKIFQHEHPNFKWRHLLIKVS